MPSIKGRHFDSFVSLRMYKIVYNFIYLLYNFLFKLYKISKQHFDYFSKCINISCIYSWALCLEHYDCYS